jgi:hypothetical protein
LKKLVGLVLELRLQANISVPQRERMTFAVDLLVAVLIVTMIVVVAVRLAMTTTLVDIALADTKIVGVGIVTTDVAKVVKIMVLLVALTDMLHLDAMIAIAAVEMTVVEAEATMTGTTRRVWLRQSLRRRQVQP